MQSQTFALKASILCCFVAALGCWSESQIRQYKVARKNKASTLAVATTPWRLVAAIVPQQNKGWFFKLNGDPAKVSPETDRLKSLIESTTFGSDGEPKWELPQSWRQESGEGITHTVFYPSSESDLKITVTQLPWTFAELTTQAWHSYVEVNVNRWRGQLSLPDDNWDKMITYLQPLEKLSMGDAVAYFVVLDGTQSDKGMSPPMFGAGGRSSMRFDNRNDRPNAKLTYTLPEGWKETQGVSAMRLASFSVEQGGKSADVSISAVGGDVRANVERWQRQLLPNAPEERIKQVIDNSQDVSVNSVASQVFYLTDDSGEEKQAILAAIIPWQSANSLFVKLTGPASVAEANRKQFLELLATLKW